MSVLINKQKTEKKIVTVARKFRFWKTQTQLWSALSSGSATATKGQLISECLFGVLNFPKNQRKI